VRTVQSPSVSSVPVAVRPVFDAVVARLDAVAQAHLTEEYVPVLRQAAAAIARKRPSPLLRGDPAVWACGITHAVGAANFLFDQSGTLYMTGAQLAEAFGVGSSTGANRAAMIRKLLKMAPYDPRWCIPSKLAEHPMAWLIQVDGIVVDARHVPIELQRQAFARGLIPYVPADRQRGETMGAVQRAVLSLGQSGD